MTEERRYPKRLIEVDLPIREISSHSRHEKSVSFGHISTLHVWWARRPLAACRAVICASLWLDPADELCPNSFRQDVNHSLIEFAAAARLDRPLRELLQENWNRWNRLCEGIWRPDDPACWWDMRYYLLDLAAAAANWKAATCIPVLTAIRQITEASRRALKIELSAFSVLDPFAGGGAIPLESMRVGSNALAGDSNPVSVSIQKVALEILPRWGQSILDDLRKIGRAIKEAASIEVGQLYGSKGAANPYAWFWARSIQCPGPSCGIKIPIVRQFWLAKNAKHRTAIIYNTNGPGQELSFRIATPAAPSDVPDGTTRRGKVTCPACGFTVPQKQLEQTLKSSSIQHILLAVADLKAGTSTKIYRLPSAEERRAIQVAESDYLSLTSSAKSPGTLNLPDQELPYLRSILNPHVYGFKKWGSLFTARQALVNLAMLKAAKEIESAKYASSESNQYINDLRILVSVLFNRQLAFMNSFCRWAPKGQHPVPPFSNNGFPMVWDFVEINPFSRASGNWDKQISRIEEFGRHIIESRFNTNATVFHADARSMVAPKNSADLLFTDPPYYDVVPYANLSDFFYVWQRQLIGDILPDLFGPKETVKDLEIVQLAGRNPSYAHKTKDFFELEMAKAFRSAREQVSEEGIACFVFAHKSTDAWEALLNSVVDAGWKVVASWPIDTERGSRVRASNAAALGSSIHLVCRPRTKEAVGDWRTVLRELPARMSEWVPHLAKEGIVGADAIFACLGPALEIFSRYSHVEKANGQQVKLREYLEHVWAAVAREALLMIFEDAETVGLEENARLTAMWLWTLSTAKSNGKTSSGEGASMSKKPATSGYTLEFDAARKIAQGLGAHLEDLDDIVEVKGDKARLLAVAERTRHLFGKDAKAPSRGRAKAKDEQLTLFAQVEAAEEQAGWGETGVPAPGSTILDRVHQSMILFAAGRSEALKRFLVDEGSGEDARFWKLAQSLSALYPAASDEKRWVDGVLARKKSLGFA